MQRIILEQHQTHEVGQIWPRHLFVGVLLVGLSWPLAWFGPSLFSEHAFFPLWLGYILAVDGLALRRSGTSLLARDRSQFLRLFAFSLPLWWLFELANQFVQNWRYVEARPHTT